MFQGLIFVLAVDSPLYQVRAYQGTTFVFPTQVAVDWWIRQLCQCPGGFKEGGFCLSPALLLFHIQGHEVDLRSEVWREDSLGKDLEGFAAVPFWPSSCGCVFPGILTPLHLSAWKQGKYMQIQEKPCPTGYGKHSSAFTEYQDKFAGTLVLWGKRAFNIDRYQYSGMHRTRWTVGYIINRAMKC